MIKKVLVMAAALCALAAAGASAAETQAGYGWQPDRFGLKFYLQPRYQYRLTDAVSGAGEKGDNGFQMRRGRFYFTAQVSPRMKGEIQVEARPEGLQTLDVWANWKPFAGHPGYSVTVGQLKKPFSYQEFVMGSSNLNLIDRPLLNTFLEGSVHVSAYDQGILGTAEWTHGAVPVTANAGVFNGNGQGMKTDDNQGKQGVARIGVTPVDGLTVAVDGSVNRLETAYPGETMAKSYSAWGADAVYQGSELTVIGEVAGGQNDQAVVAGQANPPVPHFLGGYVEAMLAVKGWEPGARIERFDPDVSAADDAQTLLTGQIARSFSPEFRWQVNVVHTAYQASGVKSEDLLVTQWTVRL